MKPFLGVDLTTDKKNMQFQGKEFLTMKPSDALSKSLESSSENAEATVERSKLRLPLRIIRCICWIVALLLISGILKADVSFSEGYNNAPFLYWGAGVCAVIWLILWLWGRQKSKTVLNSEESTQTLSNLDGVSNAIYT